MQASGQKTGTYSFRLLDAAAAPTLDTGGGTTQGTLTPGTSTQLLQFTGIAGTRLFFSWQGGAYPSYYQVVGPDNNYINSTYFGTSADINLPVDGQYTLVLFGNNTSGPASYQFKAYTPPAPVNNVAYSVGQTASGNLATAGQIDTYSFTGTSGQLLFFDGLTDGSNGNITVKLTDPTGGDVLSSNVASDYNSRPFVLTGAGTYSISVQANGQNTGTYSFRLLDAAAAPMLDLNGATTQGTITPSTGAAIAAVHRHGRHSPVLQLANRGLSELLSGLRA